jgi:hypothetical protein
VFRPFVNWVTFDRFSLQHFHRERVDVIGVGNGRVSGFRLRQDRTNTGQGQAMDQQFQQWRSADGPRLWLSMLVDTMEEISRSERRGLPLSPSVLIAVEAQLARPASSPYAHSRFSLRN